MSVALSFLALADRLWERNLVTQVPYWQAEEMTNQIGTHLGLKSALWRPLALRQQAQEGSLSHTYMQDTPVLVNSKTLSKRAPSQPTEKGEAKVATVLTINRTLPLHEGEMRVQDTLQLSLAVAKVMPGQPEVIVPLLDMEARGYKDNLTFHRLAIAGVRVVPYQSRVCSALGAIARLSARADVFGPVDVVKSAFQPTDGLARALLAKPQSRPPARLLFG